MAKELNKPELPSWNWTRFTFLVPVPGCRSLVFIELLNAPSSWPLKDADSDSWSVSVSVVNFSFVPFLEDEEDDVLVVVALAAKLSLE